MDSLQPGTSRPLPSIALVVNDDGDTSEIYERLLSDAGLWVTSCPEREAINYARDVLPDVILSDIDVRPNAAGRVILQRLRDDPGLCEVPILLVAACPPDGETARQVHTVLVKPVEPTHLLASVHVLIDTSRELRRRSRTLRQAVAAVLLRSQRAME